MGLLIEITQASAFSSFYYDFGSIVSFLLNESYDEKYFIAFYEIDFFI